VRIRNHSQFSLIVSRGRAHQPRSACRLEALDCSWLAPFYHFDLVSTKLRIVLADHVRSCITLMTKNVALRTTQDHIGAVTTLNPKKRDRTLASLALK